MVNVGIKLYDDSIHHVGDLASEMGAETTITTIVDNQKKAEIEVLACDPVYSDEYFAIGKFVIDNIPPLKAGEPRIILKFYLDEDYSLIVDAISNDVLKKQIKILKNDWAPGVELEEPGEQEEELSEERVSIEKVSEESKEKVSKKKKVEKKAVKEKKPSLFTIDLSERKTEEADGAGQTEDKDDEQGPDSKKKDVLFPILLIASIIILISFAVFFFLVIRPWEVTKKDVPGPTQPVATGVALIEDDTSGIITGEAETDANTIEPTDEVPLLVEEEAVLIDTGEINRILTEIGPLYFSPNSSMIKDSGVQKKLDRIALSIKDYKPDILLIITGHTAKAGSEEERQTLSIERAQTIRKALIEREAITEKACRIQGRGSNDPASTAPGKGSLNRRVELKVELLK